MKTFLKTVAAVSLISGAAHAEKAEFHPSTYTTYKQHSAHNGSVQVLEALPSNELSYTEIGMVRIPTKSVSDYQQALAEIKAAAAKHGGNAIVLEEDAQLFSSGALTPRGTAPANVTATAVIRH